MCEVTARPLPLRLRRPGALDRSGRTWETPRALSKAAPARRDRVLTILWVAVSVAAISYAVFGIYQGLAQQGLVGRPATVVCEYRFDLVRDRLAAMFDQAQRGSDAAATDINSSEHYAPPGADLTNLFRETFALCAGSDPAYQRRLDRMFALYSEFTERSQRHADARRELLAL
jgi:hypothetical protein